MESELKSKVARYYGEKIRTFGTAPKGVDWKDEHSQNIRFEQLLKVIDGEENISLSDLGCGYGALFLFMDNPAILSFYCGYDICEEMLINARRLINDSKAMFVNSDKITTETDYSVTSGLFNVKLDTETKIWEKFILETLSNMNEKSIKGFAFNCLTKYVDYEINYLYYGDPLFFFDYCKKNFSKYVTLIHDYELYEWTILVKKGPPT
jgi:hypothetical protein